MESQSMFLPPEVETAVRELVDYLWESESRHYRERPEAHHIYLRLRHIRLWLRMLGWQRQQEGVR